MCKYKYEKMDWSKRTTIGKYAESTNGHIMDIEIPEEHQDDSLENSIKSENTSEKEK